MKEGTGKHHILGGIAAVQSYGKWFGATLTSTEAVPSRQSVPSRCEKSLNFFAQITLKTSGILSALFSKNKYKNIWNSVFRFSSFRTYMTLRCLAKVIHIEMVMDSLNLSSVMHIYYHISRTIRRTFFPKKCDLKSTCILYAEGKYLFPNL